MFLAHVHALNNGNTLLWQHPCNLSFLSFFCTREYDNIVSFFNMHKPIELHNFWCEGNNFLISAICDLARNRAEHATCARLILCVDKYDCVLIKADIGTVDTAMCICSTHNNGATHISLLYGFARLCGLYCKYN